MNFKKFVLKHHKKLLAVLMEQQLKTPLGYDNESNIEIGVAYEKSLVKPFPHDLVHKGQKFSSTKRDLLYVRFHPLFPDLVEVKTGEYDFGALFKQNGRGPGNRTVGNYRYMSVTYKKQKGESKFSVIETLPDYLLIYQKFKAESSRPAILGLISQQHLQEIYEEGRHNKGKGADFIFYINFLDFDDGVYVERKIPQMGDGFIKEVQNISMRHKIEKDNEIEECIKKYSTGKFINC